MDIDELFGHGAELGNDVVVKAHELLTEADIVIESENGSPQATVDLVIEALARVPGLTTPWIDEATA